MRIVLTLGMLAGVCLGSGCAEKSSSPANPPATNAARPAPATVASSNTVDGELKAGLWSPSKPQPKLAVIKLFLGQEVVDTELALTEAQIRTGMMHRESMGENEGMLFVFARPSRVAFYMRNTKVPLTAAYIGPDGTILELRDMQPLDETPIEANFDNVQFVLEMNQGWFKRHNISAGTVITTEMGKLRETFRLN